MKRFLWLGWSLLAVAVPVFAEERGNQEETECKTTIEMTLAGLKKIEQQTGMKQEAYGLTAEEIKAIVAKSGFCAATKEINRHITQLFTEGTTHEKATSQSGSKCDLQENNTLRRDLCHGDR